MSAGVSGRGARNRRVGPSHGGSATWASRSPDTLTFDRVGMGQSNLTIAASDQDGRTWILRRPPHGESAALCSRRRSRGSHPPGSGAHHGAVARRSGNTESAGVPVLAMEYVDGLVIDDMAIAAEVPESVRRDRWAQHGQHARRSARGGPRARRAWMTSEATAHMPSVSSVDGRPSGSSQRSMTFRDVDTLTKRLRAAVPASEELTLVHGDFHLRNLILAPEGRYGAGGARLGAFDLGRPDCRPRNLVAYWPQPGDCETPIFQAPAMPGFVSRGDLTEQYQNRVRSRPVGAWLLAHPGSVEDRDHHPRRSSSSR